MSEPATALHRFQTIVLDDQDLQQELRRCPDRACFMALVIDRAKQHGCTIEQAEVEAALGEGTQVWMMRWIDQ